MPCVAQCPITMHEEVAPGHYRMAVQAPEIASAARPGQFAMLEVAPGYAPFLRRPMSFERIFRDGVSFLVKVEGEGTRLLARFAAGQTLAVQGPLGNGFPLKGAYQRHILVAGGIGVAPLPALAEALIPLCDRAPEVIVAARNERLLLCEDDFRQMGCVVHVATDDGSAGQKALATDMLEGLDPVPGTCVYACGPMPMMAAVAKMMIARNVDCLVSLEAQMACGDGACLGCVVATKAEREGGKMALVCSDGPVFDAGVIDWDAIGG